MRLYGYKRPDGTVGVRNHFLILPSVGCANHIVDRIASQMRMAAVFHHHLGCGQLGEDREQTLRTMENLARNPNVGSILVVGLGCEQVDPSKLVDSIAHSGKPVASVTVLDRGGEVEGVNEGVKIAQRLIRQASLSARGEIDANELVVGVKCALTDTTSGIAANPAVGKAADIVVENGGTVIFGETIEMLGAEQILADRAINEKVAKRIRTIVARMEEKAVSMGVDIRGANPSPGNIKRGITTIEEKSLGAILKGGSSRIKGVFEYGERVAGKGLYIMDSPGRTPEALTGLSAAGAQLLIMPTGGGSPGASPVVPTIKVTGNHDTFRKLEQYMDIDASSILRGEETIEDVGKRIFNEILEVASGKKTKVESLGYSCSSIFAIGPTI